MVPKVVKQNGAHLFMNMYVIDSQRYYYIDGTDRITCLMINIGSLTDLMIIKVIS